MKILASDGNPEIQVWLQDQYTIVVDVGDGGKGLAGMHEFYVDDDGDMKDAENFLVHAGLTRSQAQAALDII